jgi:hypothetical protein
MRQRFIACSVCLLLIMGSGLARAADGPLYYLALGDSLAVGWQPTSTGIGHQTNQGYVDHL